MEEHTEKMWAIHGSLGLYTGTWLTRKEAIDAHVSAYFGNTRHRDKHWRERRKIGDRAVKVEINYIA